MVEKLTGCDEEIQVQQMCTESRSNLSSKLNSKTNFVNLIYQINHIMKSISLIKNYIL